MSAGATDSRYFRGAGIPAYGVSGHLPRHRRRARPRQRRAARRAAVLRGAGVPRAPGRRPCAVLPRAPDPDVGLGPSPEPSPGASRDRPGGTGPGGEQRRRRGCPLRKTQPLLGTDTERRSERAVRDGTLPSDGETGRGRTWTRHDARAARRLRLRSRRASAGASPAAPRLRRSGVRRPAGRRGGALRPRSRRAPVAPALRASRRASCAAKGWGWLVDRLAADGVDARPRRARLRRPAHPRLRRALLLGRPRRADARCTAPCCAPRSVAQARACARENATRLRGRRARARGVPAELVAAILHVETRCGRNTGDSIVLFGLARLAMANEPDERRARTSSAARRGAARSTPRARRARARARRAARRDVLPRGARRLHARRALGGGPARAPRLAAPAPSAIRQFLPTSYLRFGTRRERRRRASTSTTIDDAAASAAAYLASHGWQGELTRAARRQVIWHYNRSDAYIDAVLALADRLARQRAPLLRRGRPPDGVPVGSVRNSRAERRRRQRRSSADLACASPPLGAGAGARRARRARAADPSGARRRAGDAAWERRAEGGDDDGRASRAPIAARHRRPTRPPSPRRPSALDAALEAGARALLRGRLRRRRRPAKRRQPRARDARGRRSPRPAGGAARRLGQPRLLRAPRCLAPARLARGELRTPPALFFWSAVAWGAWSQRHGARRRGARRRRRPPLPGRPRGRSPSTRPSRRAARTGCSRASTPRCRASPSSRASSTPTRAVPAAERALAIAPGHPGNRYLLALTLLDVAPGAARRGRCSLLEEIARTEPRPDQRVEDLAMRRAARERLAQELAASRPSRGVGGRGASPRRRITPARRTRSCARPPRFGAPRRFSPHSASATVCASTSSTGQTHDRSSRSPFSCSAAPRSGCA